MTTTATTRGAEQVCNKKSIFSVSMVEQHPLSFSLTLSLFLSFPTFKILAAAAAGPSCGAPDIRDDVNDLDNLAAQVIFIFLVVVVAVVVVLVALFFFLNSSSNTVSLSLSLLLSPRSTATTSRPPRRLPRSRPARGPRRW